MHADCQDEGGIRQHQKSPVITHYYKCNPKYGIQDYQISPKSHNIIYIIVCIINNKNPPRYLWQRSTDKLFFISAYTDKWNFLIGRYRYHFLEHIRSSVQYGEELWTPLVVLNGAILEEGKSWCWTAFLVGKVKLGPTLSLRFCVCGIGRICMYLVAIM